MHRFYRLRALFEESPLHDGDEDVDGDEDEDEEENNNFNNLGAPSSSSDSESSDSESSSSSSSSSDVSGPDHLLNNISPVYRGRVGGLHFSLLLWVITFVG
jgi:hypothetical protein